MGLYFMLLAGASADSPYSYGGALTFIMNVSLWWVDWFGGSAFMLFAGAATNDPSALGGAFPFDVVGPPSWAGWSIGSALFLLSIFICILCE